MESWNSWGPGNDSLKSAKDFIAVTAVGQPSVASGLMSKCGQTLVV